MATDQKIIIIMSAVFCAITFMATIYVLWRLDRANNKEKEEKNRMLLGYYEGRNYAEYFCSHCQFHPPPIPMPEKTKPRSVKSIGW